MKRLCWLLLVAACAPADPPKKKYEHLNPKLPTLVYYRLADGCLYCEVIVKAFDELRPVWKERINLDVRPADGKQSQSEMNIFAGLGVAVREFKLTSGDSSATGSTV